MLRIIPTKEGVDLGSAITLRASFLSNFRPQRRLCATVSEDNQWNGAKRTLDNVDSLPAMDLRLPGVRRLSLKREGCISAGRPCFQAATHQLRANSVSAAERKVSCGRS
jgi:hypothetical protein